MNDIFLLVPLLFVGGVLSTIVGGGLSIVAIIAVNFFPDIRLSISLAALLLTTIHIAKMVYFYRNARWNIVGWYAAIGIPASYLGGRMLFMVPERVPETMLAGVVFAFVVMRLRRKAPTLATARTNPLVLGGVNGLVGGLAGNTSMMRLPVLLFLGLGKEVLIGTSALIAFPMNLGKIVVYIPNLKWTREYTVFFLTALPAVFMGVWLGKCILKTVSRDLFEKFLLCVIFLGALRLLLA